MRGPLRGNGTPLRPKSELQPPDEKSHMCGCQNCGSFLGPYSNTAPIFFGYPKRDHSFDNHPYNPWTKFVVYPGNRSPYTPLYIPSSPLLICRSKTKPETPKSLIALPQKVQETAHGDHSSSLKSTYNWAYNPTCNWGNPYKPI